MSEMKKYINIYGEIILDIDLGLARTVFPEIPTISEEDLMPIPYSRIIMANGCPVVKYSYKHLNVDLGHLSVLIFQTWPDVLFISLPDMKPTILLMRLVGMVYLAKFVKKRAVKYLHVKPTKLSLLQVYNS
ncbi:hypothetical protein ACTXT7_013287 [Hymenolepis weldensis]